MLCFFDQVIVCSVLRQIRCFLTPISASVFVAGFSHLSLSLCALCGSVALVLEVWIWNCTLESNVLFVTALNLGSVMFLGLNVMLFVQF
jgi:hypothetical protein